MKRFSLVLLTLALALPCARAQLSPDTIRRAKSRIEALLSNRRGVASVPTNPANPFVLPQTAQEGPVQVASSPTFSKSDTLTRLAANLNVSGYVQIQGVPHLIINRQAYRENDLIPVREANGGVTFLRLKSISDREFILELDETELLLKHTVK